MGAEEFQIVIAQSIERQTTVREVGGSTLSLAKIFFFFLSFKCFCGCLKGVGMGASPFKKSKTCQKLLFITFYFFGASRPSYKYDKLSKIY
jgi:hypothetical protein